MVVICLNGVADRCHGYLRSIMLNVHTGVYVSMDLDAGSRDRVWAVLEDWWQWEPRGQAVMIYRDKSKPMEIDFRILGGTKRPMVEYEEQYALLRSGTEEIQSIE